MVALSFVSLSLLALNKSSLRMSSSIENKPEVRRIPTFRSISSTLSEDRSSTTSVSEIVERANEMNQRAKNLEPFTEQELMDVLHSIQNVTPNDREMPYQDLKALLQEVAHLSHKNWTVTDQNAQKLQSLLGTIDQSRQLLERILREGNWDGAVVNADGRQDTAAWAVLVTGVNGIRKTTSMYQPWFADLLKEALVVPSGKTPPETLPTGQNSFFRQLDHMIATLCNEDFTDLYTLTSDLVTENNGEITPDIVEKYSNFKAAIFTRFRTLSELLGALLLRQAQDLSINCMLETSGRDIAMFDYVDHFFPDNNRYRKLALHFQINDLQQAKTSVDNRMITEIKAGMKAIQTNDWATVFDIIYTNAGGPYGSQVLEGIQAESDDVWHNQVLKSNFGPDWYKATIQIMAYEDRPWTAQAVRQDGTLGTLYEFTAPRTM